MKLTTGLGVALNAVVVASMVMIGISAKAETLVMLEDDDISITQSLTFNEEQFPEVNCMALNVYYETRGSNLEIHMRLLMLFLIA